jgi:Calcineurin-like phosphoesterase
MMKVTSRWKQSAGALLLALSVLTSIGITGCASIAPKPLGSTQFVFTSDPHYGITRENFPTIGAPKADAHTVNAAMVEAINSLPTVTLPCDDHGVNACRPVGAIDFVANTGDIANRMEVGAKVPSAADSWAQFEADYINGLTLKDKNGNRAPLFLVPGNHDVSNAIGFYKTMNPLKDATSASQIFNRMMNPATLRTNDTYNYATDKVFCSKEIGGVHFIFISMWPDSAARAWIETDLAKVDASMPVVLFTHDEPPSESTHFTNPNGANDINGKDKFENLLADKFADAMTINDASGNPVPTVIEQRALVSFLKAHKNIVAYFHGNDHINGAFIYTGPDNDVSLNVFSVDSPMKGTVSAGDPTRLTFKVVAIDPDAKNMTVRDYQWNTRTWGAATTVSLAPRSK